MQATLLPLSSLLLCVLSVPWGWCVIPTPTEFGQRRLCRPRCPPPSILVQLLFKTRPFIAGRLWSEA